MNDEPTAYYEELGRRLDNLEASVKKLTSDKERLAGQVAASARALAKLTDQVIRLEARVRRA